MRGIPMHQVCKSTSTYPVPCSRPLRTLGRDIAWETAQPCKRLRQADSQRNLLAGVPLVPHCLCVSFFKFIVVVMMYACMTHIHAHMS